MSLLSKKKKNRPESQKGKKKRRVSKTAQKKTGFRLDYRWLISFFLINACVIAICFWGLSPAGISVVKDQIATFRIVSEFPFTYVSQIETEKLRDSIRKRTAPVYRLDQSEWERFSAYLKGLNEAITKKMTISDELIDERKKSDSEEIEKEDAGALQVLEMGEEEWAQLIYEYDPDETYHMQAQDWLPLINSLAPVDRNAVIEEGLTILHSLYLSGIYDKSEVQTGTHQGTGTFLNIDGQNDSLHHIQIQTEEEALRALRINLLALNIDRNIATSLFRILRIGLHPNLEYDEAKTEALIEKRLHKSKEVTVDVQQGQTIIVPHQTVSARDIEMLNAYRKRLDERNENYWEMNRFFIERALMTLVISLMLSIYLRINRRPLISRSRTFWLICVISFVNLGLIRIILELMAQQLLLGNNNIAMIFPWMVPVALGPMILSMLVGNRAGIVLALALAIFNSLMQGSSIMIALASFFAAIVGVYLLKGIQMRNKLIRAGFLSGLSFALCAFILGVQSSLTLMTISQQMLVAILVGTITGIIVVGLLPVLEQGFKYTTNITLLELTDYNHPLLRKLQIDSPGSYHHSVMVANLAENAAAAIGANPLVCRVCSLFHDIGKTVKPEYFTENQLSGVNPHLERNPSMSALIIKAHVKEGVALAEEYNLPEIIINVIKEHHGTSLIQYFYYKALEAKKSNMTIMGGMNAPKIDLTPAEENTYRYDGPRPQFLESAIIMLADSIEAASRSLKKVTPQNVEDLIRKIVQARLNDGQLDDSEITLKQLSKVKESFAFTLLNMMHSRVEYPKRTDEDKDVVISKHAEKRDRAEGREEPSSKKSIDQKKAEDTKDA